VQKKRDISPNPSSISMKTGLDHRERGRERKIKMWNKNSKCVDYTGTKMMFGHWRNHYIC